MICPRCKQKNSDEDRVCKNCGLKLKTICPRCKEPNKLGQAKCTKCNLTLIRFCPKCKTPNFPHAKNCRKCGFEMPAAKKKQSKPVEEVKKVKAEEAKQEVKQKVKPEQPVEKPQPPQKKPEPPKPEPPKEPASAPSIQPEASIPEKEFEEEKSIEQDNFKKELTRNEAALFLQKILSNSDKGCLIGLSSPDGIGKSTIISSLTRNIKDKQIIWLIGQCEPIKKSIPYSFFRDLMCNLFGVPLLTSDKEEIKKSLKKTFEANFEITDEKVLNNVFKICLNEYQDCNPDIEINQKEIHESILKIIQSLQKKALVVLITEDFEYIDKASFDCIKYLLKKGFLDDKNFLLINHNNSTNLSKLFPEEVSSKKFLLILIKYLNNEELNRIILSMMNNQDVLPDGLKYRIFRQSKGLPIYVEQALWYLFQTGAIYAEEKGLNFNSQYKDVEIIPDFSELASHRIEMIEKLSPDAEKIMFTAAVFGFKFIPKFVQMVAEIEEQKMQETLQLLVNNGIFAVVDQHTLSFKHINLWKIIFERGLNEGKIGEISSKILSVLEKTVRTNSAFMARLSEYAGNTDNTIYYYNNAIQESFSLGDSLSYTDNQVKVYELLPASQLTEEEIEIAKLNISEQIGKVNYELNPAIAIKYLSESIKRREKEGDNVKLIELTGYMSKSCELTGDFIGVLDCAEKAVALTKKSESSLEVMLLKFPKTDATFNLGRLQETIMTIQDEILPSLTRAISRNETLPGLTVEDIKEIEYETGLTLAKALIFQGNKQAVEVLNKIAAKAEKENRRDYEVKALLGQALFATIQGNIDSCENILGIIEEKDLPVNMTDETRLQWLFISILSSMMTGNFDQARNTCYSALSLAKESRNYNIFALVKLLSGFFYQHFQYYKNALTIYEETANYCSETKMATGALYAWYFAAEAELQTGNIDKAREIAEKALDVSQKPNINNFLITILLSRLLAEIKIISNDLEGAQINLESGLSLAEDNDLYYLLIELYITLGKIYQENASVNEEKRDYSCSCAHRTYTKALELAEKIDNDFLIEKVDKILSNLNTFCKLSGITMEK